MWIQSFTKLAQLELFSNADTSSSLSLYGPSDSKLLQAWLSDLDNPHITKEVILKS